MPNISNKRLLSLQSAASRARKKVGARGKSKGKRFGFSIGRSAGRAILISTVRKVAPTKSLQEFSLPADLAISGVIAQAAGGGGKHLIQTGIELAGARAWDKFVLPRALALAGGGGGGGSPPAGGAGVGF